MWGSVDAVTSHFARCAAGASFIVAAAGCGGPAAPTGVCAPLPEGVGYRPPSASALQHSLVVPTRVHIGASVPLLLVLHNRSDSAIAVNREIASQAEFIVTRQRDSGTVWRRFPDGLVSILFSEDTMLPGATRSFSAIWKQRDDSGGMVDPGTYCVYGYLMHDPSVASPAPPTTLTIER